MVTFLRKLFIKDYKNTSDPAVRKKHGVLAAVYGIISNSILVLLKITGALVIAYNTNWALFPIALLADAINNASDAVSSVITLVSFNLAAKPGDDEHPFGHERVEYLAAVIVSMLVIVVAVDVFKESLDKVITGNFADYDLLSIILLFVAVLMKILQFYVVKGLGKAISSPALKATAIDAILDSLITGVIAICAILSCTLKWSFLDGWLGMGVACFITVTGARSFFESMSPLIGEKSNKELINKIESIALSTPKVIGVHDILCHSYGPTKQFVSLHLEIPEDLSFIEAHDIAETIENRISNELKLAITIHVDPVKVNDPLLDKIKEDVTAVIKKYDPEGTAHDFRLINTASVKRINFDVVLSFKKEDISSKITDEIINKFKEDGLDFKPVINFEHPY